MRWLPNGVSELNAPQKRRVFDFANEHGEHALREQLRQKARELVVVETTPVSLESLANDIYSRSGNLTFGLLLIEGVAAHTSDSFARHHSIIR